MNYKGFVKKYIFIVFTTISLFAALSIIVDPYGVFKSKLLKNDYQPNERFIKVDYLLKNKDKYNSYMFGSSRIGNTDPKVIEEFLPDSKFYNMTTAVANIEDYKIILKWMIENKFNIKYLYVQIDLDNFYFHGHDNNLLLRHHYNVDNSGFWDFYSAYLFKVPFKIIKKKIKHNFKDNVIIFDFYNTGMWRNLQKEELLKNEPQKYVKNELSFHGGYGVSYKIGSNYKEIINDLSEIVKLCKSHDIKLIGFTTPHNHNMMDTFDKQSVLKFVNDISQIMDFWYFSGYNFITNNDTNYYETSHYKEEIGAEIAKTIFNKSDNIDTFGIFVTEKNRLKVLKYISQNIENHRKK